MDGGKIGSILGEISNTSSHYDVWPLDLASRLIDQCFRKSGRS
jgi:hypothetical protein